jgi:endoglucanase
MRVQIDLIAARSDRRGINKVQFPHLARESTHIMTARGSKVFGKCRAWSAAATVILLTGLMVGIVRPAYGDPDVSVEAETMSIPPAVGGVYFDPGASAQKKLLIWSNGTASTTVTTPNVERIVVRARGDLCEGAPRMVVEVDGLELSHVVFTTYWTNYSADITLPAGQHTVRISFANDHATTSCDRNLRVDKVTLVATNPFAGAKFYVDPHSPVKTKADESRFERPDDAAQLDKIASQPRAFWFGDDSSDQVRAHVSGLTTRINNAGALPVYVAYNIPQRDCGRYSAGGAATAQAYREWIQAFADGIGSQKAVVLVEPDALSDLDSCLTSDQQQQRLELLNYAVDTLSAKDNIFVYLDGGHPLWHPPSIVAEQLQYAGIARARGFYLNVSNFVSTLENISYGRRVSSLVGGKPFIIDTGRNGLGHYDISDPLWWCNPPGRALGDPPTASAAGPLVDAYYWVKDPYESDGTCNGGPPAGAGWAHYALGLAERAAY